MILGPIVVFIVTCAAVYWMIRPRPDAPYNNPPTEPSRPAVPPIAIPYLCRCSRIDQPHVADVLCDLEYLWSLQPNDHGGDGYEPRQPGG